MKRTWAERGRPLWNIPGALPAWHLRPCGVLRRLSSPGESALCSLQVSAHGWDARVPPIQAPSLSTLGAPPAPPQGHVRPALHHLHALMCRTLGGPGWACPWLSSLPTLSGAWGCSRGGDGAPHLVAQTGSLRWRWSTHSWSEGVCCPGKGWGSSEIPLFLLFLPHAPLPLPHPCSSP